MSNDLQTKIRRMLQAEPCLTDRDIQSQLKEDHGLEDHECETIQRVISEARCENRSAPERMSNAANRAAEYWDGRYNADLSSPFEWIKTYADISGIVEEATRADRTCHILNVGCGNSLITESMYDDGYHNIVNIDVSSVVIEQMQERNAHRQHMCWLHMDATCTSFIDDGFDVILDKGTLDAIAINNFDKFASSKEAQPMVAQYLKEMKRLLRTGGTYVCFSLEEPRDRFTFFEQACVMQPIVHRKLASDEPPAPFTRDIHSNHVYSYRKELDCSGNNDQDVCES